MSVPGAFARVAYSLPPFWLGWKGNCGKTEIETYTEKVGYVLFIASNLLKTMVCQKFRKTYNITFKFSKIGGEWCYENTDLQLRISSCSLAFGRLAACLRRRVKGPGNGLRRGQTTKNITRQ